MYANFVAPIKKFEGIAWRMRNIIESVDIAYIGSIAYLRAFKRNSERRPNHVDVLFSYFTDPVPTATNPKPFESVAEFQNFMTEEVAPIVAAQLEKYSKILSVHNNDDVPIFMFDAALVVKTMTGKIVSPTNRMRKFMPGHLRGMMANMHERMGMGFYAASYNLEGLQYFLNKLSRESLAAKKAGMNTGRAGAFLADALNLNLQSPKEVSRILKEDKLSHFLTLRQEAKERNFLDTSLKHLRTANGLRIEAYKNMEVLAKKGNQNTYFADADYITSRPAITLNALVKRQVLLADTNKSFVDRVDGSEFQINLAQLFNKTNPGIQDLKKLYPDPTHFKNDEPFIGKNKNTFKWNYEYGSPQNWPDVTFAGLLPDTKSAKEYKSKLVSISRDASTPALNYWLHLFM